MKHTLEDYVKELITGNIEPATSRFKIDYCKIEPNGKIVNYALTALTVAHAMGAVALCKTKARVIAPRVWGVIRIKI